MGHSQSVRINTPIPSVEDYGRRLGLSKSRQRDLIRLVNPDFADEVQITPTGVMFKTSSAKATVGKVVSKGKGTITVQIVPQKSKAHVSPQKLKASDRFKLAGLGDKVRIVSTAAKSKSRLSYVKVDSADRPAWSLDEVVSRSNAGKRTKIAAK